MLSSKLYRLCSQASRRVVHVRTFSSSTSSEGVISEDVIESSPQKPGGFHQAFMKYTQLDQAESAKDNTPFATLMRHSKFIDLGDPAGKVVSGTVFHIVNDDLYIDFGGKFHCVCTRPPKNGHLYMRGSIVKLRLKALELSTKFLGSERDLSLLEADADLIGLISTPRKSR